jgi:hypothetical protein
MRNFCKTPSVAVAFMVASLSMGTPVFAADDPSAPRKAGEVTRGIWDGVKEAWSATKETAKKTWQGTKETAREGWETSKETAGGATKEFKDGWSEKK